MGIPAQGTSNTVVDYRNPTLIPNFDVPVANGANAGNLYGGSVDLESPGTFLSANTRVAATATATIGSSVTTGDEITIKLSNGILNNPSLASAPNGEISHTVTAGGSDTDTTLAEALAKAFNDDATAQAVGIYADVAGAVITFNHAGPVGNFSVLSNPGDEPSKITITGTATAGDLITALFTGPNIPGGSVAVSYTTTSAESVTNQAVGLRTAINANATLAALGITALNTAGVINLTVAAAAEPVTITAYANTPDNTATITGPVAAGDVITYTITNANLPSGSVTVSYTTLIGATTTSIAQGLAAAIEADAFLQTAGVTATSATNVLTVTYPFNAGAFTFSESVTTGAETVTLLAAPTEILTYATSGTETVTFSNSGKLSGGSGAVFAVNNFEWLSGHQIQAFFYGKPYILPYNVLSTMVAQGAPII